MLSGQTLITILMFYLFFTLIPPINAENIKVTSKEQDSWLRYLIPLPQKISIKQKISLEPKDVSIKVREHGSDKEKYATSKIERLFKDKTGAIPSGKTFEIIVGIMDKEGKLDGITVKNAQMLFNLSNNEQAYIIQPHRDNKLLLTAIHKNGVFYATMTLCQLLEPFITHDRVDIPFVEIMDWPDIEERGLWNFPQPEKWIPWLSSLKLNYGKMASIELHMIERNKKNSATIDRELMMKGRLMGFNYLPYIIHLNFLHIYRLFRAYPELAGIGDGALAGRYFAHKLGNQHRVPCAANPILTQILTEWMMDIASQGADEVSCWLSERPAQCGHKECVLIGQFVLEARAFVNAWRETCKNYPDFSIRLFISTTTSERYYKVLAETPPEVKLERCCSTELERVRYLPRDLYINQLFDHYASEGRWVANYDVPITANGRVETPEFKVPCSSAYRIRDFVRQLKNRNYRGAYGMMAWSNLGIETCGFNINALAEWSWNLNGRSEKEFAIAWATRESYKNPEAVGDWSELMGPVEFDVYDSDFPICYSWGKAVTMVNERKCPLPGEGMFRYYASAEEFDQKITVCKKALEIAKTFEKTDLANETKIILSYLNLAKNIYEIAELVATNDLSTLESQEKLRALLLNLENAGKKNVEAIKEWRSTLGPEPWAQRVHDAIKATEATVDQISQIVSVKYFY